MRGGAFRNGWRRQALLGVFVCLLALVVFVPQLGEPASRIPAPISISTDSYNNYALLVLPFRADDNLWAVKSNKNDLCGKRILARDTVTVLWQNRFAVPRSPSYLKQIHNFTIINSSDFHQAYLLLDIPPPASV